MRRIVWIWMFLLVWYAPPVRAQAPIDIVREVRGQYPPMVSPMDAPQLLRDVATKLAQTQGGSWGLLVKESGNNCGGYACDIVCDGSNHWDVLIDGPDNSEGYSGRAEPSWQPKGLLLGRTCDFVSQNPGGGHEPPPSDYQQFQAALEELRARLTDLEGLRGEYETLRQRVNTLATDANARLQLLEARPLPEPFPCWTVNTSRSLFHGHQVKVGNCQ